MNINKTVRYITATVLLLATLSSTWFFLNNLQRFGPALYSGVAILIVGVILFLRLFTPSVATRIVELVKKIVRYKYFTWITLAIIVLVGVIIRFSFCLKFSYFPVSDPLTFFDAAQKIAQGHGMTGDHYTAFFPYLAAYDSLLGLTMKVIHHPWIATIILNTTLDLGAATCAYFLLKRLTTADSRVPLLAFGIWFLNPFNILFSILSLPIVAVNFFIIAMLYVISRLIQSITVKHSISILIYSFIAGLFMGIGNSFRPIFSISLIGLGLVFVYLFIKGSSWVLFKGLFVSFVVVVLVFFGIQKIDLWYVSSQTGIPAVDSAAWSLYVGSDSESDGTWNQLDQDREKIICKDTLDNKDCQQKLQVAAIQRYKSQGVIGIINLFTRKLYRFSSDQSVTYNINDSVTGYSTSSTAKLMNLYITVFMALLFAFSTKYLYQSTKNILLKKEFDPIIFYISLLLLGFFLSIVLVETSPRYAQVLYPLFTILAALSFSRLPRRHSHTH